MRLSLYKNLLPESNTQTTLELRHFIDCGVTLFDPYDKYPIWDEKHRPELEKKIIDHYYNQQIGFETWGRFKHEVNVRMREIMPYYVEMYKTTKYEYNPIHNYDMNEEFTDDAEQTAHSNGKNIERISDTPQSSIDNLENYMSSASINDSNGSSEGNNHSKHTGWRKGNIGVTSTQQLIEQERKIILNLDVMIIERLQDLFLGVL